MYYNNTLIMRTLIKLNIIMINETIKLEYNSVFTKGKTTSKWEFRTFIEWPWFARILSFFVFSSNSSLNLCLSLFLTIRLTSSSVKDLNSLRFKISSTNKNPPEMIKNTNTKCHEFQIKISWYLLYNYFDTYSTPFHAVFICMDFGIQCNIPL